MDNDLLVRPDLRFVSSVDRAAGTSGTSGIKTWRIRESTNDELLPAMLFITKFLRRTHPPLAQAGSK